MLYRSKGIGEENFYIFEIKEILEPKSGKLMKALFIKPVTSIMKILWMALND